MKIALVLLAVVAYATGEQIADPFADRSLSSIATDAIEGLRDQMPCGFPGMGIPPLAPLKIAHKEVNINTPTLQMHGSVDNFRVNGLNDFDVAEMRINAILSKANFRFVFRNVNVDTSYDLTMQLKKAGFTIDMVGAGPARFAIKDMHVWGVIRYSLGITSGKLKLKTLEIRTRIGDVESNIEGVLGDGGMNNKLNDILAEVVQLAVNENEDMITETIESIALPVVNGLLSDIVLSDLVGGSGGDKEACIPPADN